MKQITPGDHFLERRSVHPAHRRLHTQPISAPLYVVTAVFNPQRFESRQRLYHQFEKHAEDAGAIPYTVELALRDRHFEVTDFENPRHIQVRGESELWYKENLFNIGVRHLPADWEYVALVDADFHFTRADWAEETLQMLQHYHAVQMYAHLTYESFDHRPLNHMRSFAYLHVNRHDLPAGYGHQGAVGGAWAFRRSAFAQIGGMLDCCILGSGDWHMAFGLAMRTDYHPELTELRNIPEYISKIRKWHEQAKVLKGNIGYVDGHAIHNWHGSLKNRQYITRPQILVRNHFDPTTDLIHDENGVLQLAGNKPALRDDIRAYFRQRHEDSIDILT